MSQSDSGTVMASEARIVIVLPAYNAAQTLEKTYADIPREKIFRIILVDDVSQDQTVEIARALGLSVVIHVQNRGYGGNQKTCYLEALKAGADVVVMLHPDHQYDSRLVPELVAPILAGDADMVMGSRILNGGALKGGMPRWLISPRAEARSSRRVSSASRLLSSASRSWARWSANSWAVMFRWASHLPLAVSRALAISLSNWLCKALSPFSRAFRSVGAGGMG